MSEPNWPQGPRFVTRRRGSGPGQQRVYVVDRAYCHEAVKGYADTAKGRTRAEADCAARNTADRNALTGNEGAATIAPVPAYCALFQEDAERSTL